MAVKKIELTRPAGQSSMGPDVRQVLPTAIDHVDPFIFLDHYGPFEKPAGWAGVPDHPHAGITTVTYLLSGTNRHEDSLGNDIVAEVGDLSWMRAGRGIVHAEGRFTQSVEPEISHGVQFWISLPAKDKFIEPAYFHYAADALPEFEDNGVRVKVLGGQWGEQHSPVKSESPIYLFDVSLAAGTSVSIPVFSGHSCGLYVIAGEVSSDEQVLPQLSITQYDRRGTDIHVSATQESRIVVFGGTPLDEPIVPHGSFVLNSDEQIQQVIKRYHAGEMGTIEHQ